MKPESTDSARGSTFLRGGKMPKIGDWLPLIIQTITLLAGGIVYANGQEHRVTIIEEALKSQRAIIEQQAETQRLLTDQLRDAQHTLDRVVTLEDFFHGMTPDEFEGYQRAKLKAQNGRE
jgi:uncharacterized coiled-coil protein SlyX